MNLKSCDRLSVASDTVGDSNARTQFFNGSTINSKPTRQQKIAALMLVIGTCQGCRDFVESPGTDISESIGQTYDEYKANMGDRWFDLTGASEISQRTAFEGDGYDAWWKFRASRSDFASIATSIAKDRYGPTQIRFSNEASPPESWRPGANVPDWWSLPLHDRVHTLHWCFKADVADRHHGWFFLYSDESSQIFVWHWNHQWSATECQ